MNSYYGSHGTTYSRYCEICDTGFKIGFGRIGHGIYFWKKSYYDNILSIGWYRQQLKSNKYSQDFDKRGVVIKVVLSSETDRIIDIDDSKLKDEIAELAFKKKINTNNYKEIAGIYELVIKKIEEKIGKKILIIEARVTTPGERFCPEYPIKLMGLPYCYIVRDNNCISIASYEIIKEDINYE